MAIPPGKGRWDHEQRGSYQILQGFPVQVQPKHRVRWACQLFHWELSQELYGRVWGVEDAVYGASQDAERRIRAAHKRYTVHDHDHAHLVDFLRRQGDDHIRYHDSYCRELNPVRGFLAHIQQLKTG